jgi:hypothetical protein
MLMKCVGCLVVCLSAVPLSALEVVSPWDQAYRSLETARATGDKEEVFRQSGIFLDYARFGFLPAGDPRVTQEKIYWEGESTRRKAAAPEAPVSDEPELEDEPAPSQHGVVKKTTRHKTRARKKSAPTLDLTKRSDEAIRNGRYDEAERLLERAKILDPESTEIRHKWESLETEMGR